MCVGVYEELEKTRPSVPASQTTPTPSPDVASFVAKKDDAIAKATQKTASLVPESSTSGFKRFA